MAILAALTSAFVVTQVAAQVMLGAPPGPLAVRLTSDVGQCPSTTQVESALRRVLETGERSASGWTLYYGRDDSESETTHPARVRMELVDPSGFRLLVRQIPAQTDDCSAIASAMAAVVERSLRTLGWTRGGPLSGSLPAAPEGARPTDATKPSWPRVKQPLSRLVVGLGPLLGTSPLAGTNLLLEARLHVSGPFLLRLGGSVFADGESQEVGKAKVHVTSRAFTAAPLAAFMLGAFELAGGPALRLGFDVGQSTDLVAAAKGDRLVLAAGAGLDIAMRLSAHWRGGLGLEAFHAMLGAEYVVQVGGVRRTVLSSPTWQGIASAMLEFIAWP